MEKSFAYELLDDLKKQYKRLFVILFVIWIITFLTLIGVTCYTIYLVSDIGVIEENNSQEINNVEKIDNSSITNGGN